MCHTDIFRAFWRGTEYDGTVVVATFDKLEPFTRYQLSVDAGAFRDGTGNENLQQTIGTFATTATVESAPRPTRSRETASGVHTKALSAQEKHDAWTLLCL